MFLVFDLYTPNSKHLLSLNSSAFNYNTGLADAAKRKVNLVSDIEALIICQLYYLGGRVQWSDRLC